MNWTRTPARAGTCLALLLSLVSSCLANYRQKAEEATAFVQAHFYDPQAGRYHSRFPVDPKALPYEMMWGNGVQWTALVAATRQNPTRDQSLLYAFGEGLQKYWDPQPPVPGFNAYCSGPGGDDKYFDDNAWMVLGFVEAFDVTHDPKFLQWARATQAFVLSGWDEKLGGGIYWHLRRQSKNTCANAPAAVAALRLYEVTHDRAQLDWALRIRKWLNSTLQDKGGLYWDNEKLDGTIDRTKWTYNTGLMIRANVLLFQILRDSQYLREAERLAGAALRAWQNPATGAFTNNANFTHLLCESLLRLYDADGDVRYLNAVRRHAAYGSRVVHDPAGGYWTDWAASTHRPDEPKALIENAADARLFWLLAPYPDVEELYAQGLQAASRSDDVQAENLFRQAADSDTEAVEARYRLWKVLIRSRRTADAATEAATLAALGKNPAFRTRLEILGWKSPADAQAIPTEKQR